MGHNVWKIWQVNRSIRVWASKIVKIVLQFKVFHMVIKLLKILQIRQYVAQLLVIKVYLHVQQVVIVQELVIKVCIIVMQITIQPLVILHN